MSVRARACVCWYVRAASVQTACAQRDAHVIASFLLCVTCSHRARAVTPNVSCPFFSSQHITHLCLSDNAKLFGMGMCMTSLAAAALASVLRRATRLVHLDLEGTKIGDFVLVGEIPSFMPYHSCHALHASHASHIANA